MKKDKALPHGPVTGDRIRLKPERMKEYSKACAVAGYADFDPYAIHEVTRVDHFAPGGGDRLFVEKPPHCFRPADVMLAWNLEQERKEMLLARGWQHIVKPEGESWLAP